MDWVWIGLALSWVWNGLRSDWIGLKFGVRIEFGLVSVARFWLLGCSVTTVSVWNGLGCSVWNGLGCSQLGFGCSVSVARFCLFIYITWRDLIQHVINHLL